MAEARRRFFLGKQAQKYAVQGGLSQVERGGNVHNRLLRLPCVLDVVVHSLLFENGGLVIQGEEGGSETRAVHILGFHGGTGQRHG